MGTPDGTRGQFLRTRWWPTRQVHLLSNSNYGISFPILFIPAFFSRYHENETLVTFALQLFWTHEVQHSIEQRLPAILCRSRACVGSGNQVRRKHDTATALLTPMTVKDTEQVDLILGVAAATVEP